MRKERPRPPDDIKLLLDLVSRGQLFEVQEWIATGKRLKFPENERVQFCPLYQAVEQGFHSLVQVLLHAGGWTEEELNEAIRQAMVDKRPDLVTLLRMHGASVGALDFADICRTVDLVLMEELLRAGADPSQGNGFARGLNETKARPLLRFYKALKDEFPALHSQASLALADAVENGHLRWVALLRWAGADPWMRVPHSIYDGWTDDDHENGRQAADIACYKGIEMIKVLQLRPSAEQAREMLERVSYSANVVLLKQILKAIPKEELNSGDPPTSRAAEILVKGGWTHYFGRASSDEHDKAVASCLETILENGGKWHPDNSELRWARRTLTKCNPEFIVRIVRLLVHFPGAADPSVILELCKAPLIRFKIEQSDKWLAKDIDVLQQKNKLQRRGCFSQKG